MSESRKTGTREWSDHSVNCCLGCRHGCLYCYARVAALRWGRIKTGEDWTNERPDADAATRRWPKHRGVVMFPTAHDITPGNCGACVSTLAGLLKAGNRVLVVSKAETHVVPILLAAKACAARGENRVELRVSLTCLAQEVAAFWEPGAPTPRARIDALRAARREGLATSVSMEPLLEPDRAKYIFAAALDEDVGGEIWIGAANQLRARTAWCRGRPGLEAEIARIEAGQTPEAMRKIYEALRGHPQVRWKDSYQQALGIDAMGKKVYP